MLSVMAVLSVMNGDENGSLDLSARYKSATDKNGRHDFQTQRCCRIQHRYFPVFRRIKQSLGRKLYHHRRDLGWIYGYMVGSFEPDSRVTYAQAVTVVLRMLGYSDSYFTGVWPSGQMSTCRSLGLDKKYCSIRER
jgi:hypothetical protein